LLLSQFSFSQKNVPIFGKINWINGFSKEISGEYITYFSAYPDYATVALLTRCTDGQKKIEWETAPVPPDSKDKYVYFSWVAAHSSGTSSGICHFDLYINDEKLLTFTTLPAHQKPDWTFAAADSSRLVFQQTKRDGANDAHGLAYLRLPASRVTPGKPIRLKVVGQAQNSNDWYMTFKFSFEEKVDIEPMPFILKDGSQPVMLTALHFGKPQAIQVKVNDTKSYSFIAKEGINTFDIPLPAVQKKDSVHLKITVNKKVLVNKYVQLQPIIHRELHFIHHSHTDIGYSHLQPEVANIHNKNIRDALAMIEATRNLPPDARFKWNIEALWPVENFLNEATPAEKAAFVEAVKEGSICLTALYANLLTGISLPEEMFHYTDYADKLRHQFGFNITTAMIGDIPGATWTTVTALANGGVRYFSSGPNYLGENHPYWGDRVGHFVKTWGDKPVWWASPSGEEKILFWTAARGYSSWHGTAPGAVFERGPKKIAAYLNDLAANEYPYDIVQWRYNIVADNGPIDTSIARFVDQWNKKYTSPKIILNTVNKLFETFEKKYGDVLPIVKGDITPYWEDGAISTAIEEGKNRVNALRLQQLTTLYAMLNPQTYNQDQFYEAWKYLLLFHEHTWGAYNSISEPDARFVKEQWRIKQQFFLDADTKITSLEEQLFQPIRQRSSNKIAVYNTLSWKRSGVVFVPNIGDARSVKDAAGNKYPLQKLQDGSGVFIAVDVPPLGSAFYEMSQEEAPSSMQVILGDNSISNGKISAAWDKNNGSLTQLQTTGNFNYAGAFNQQGLNSYWYVPGLAPANAKTNGHIQVKILEQGPVMAKVSLHSEAPGSARLERILTLDAGSDQLELENIVDKLAVREKEALHFGFPFHSSLDRATLDAGYGTMSYLGDQLPGSNMDYLCGRRWMDVSAANRGVQLLFLESPMVEPAGMIDEQRTINNSHKAWKTEGHPTATWFSYAMNNYWHTNYKADQEGVARFHYALRPHGMFNHSDTEKAAASFTHPLMAVPVKDGFQSGSSLFELSNSRIVVTAVVPQDGGGFLVRLFNPEPSAQTTRFLWNALKTSAIISIKNGSEKPADFEFKLAAMDVATFLVKL
jgi:hypothetical protein